MIKVIPCGTMVEIILLKMKAMITGITIRFNAVAYEVSYFHDGEYQNVWLHESQFTIEQNIESREIGFKNNK